MAGIEVNPGDGKRMDRNKGPRGGLVAQKKSSGDKPGGS